MIRVTAEDLTTGLVESIDIDDDRFVVITGAARAVVSDNAYRTGTTVTSVVVVGSTPTSSLLPAAAPAADDHLAPVVPITRREPVPS